MKILLTATVQLTVEREVDISNLDELYSNINQLQDDIRSKNALARSRYHCEHTEAGRVWSLVGDEYELAIKISYTPQSMPQFVIEVDGDQEAYDFSDYLDYVDAHKDHPFHVESWGC